jgi:hypothetical protein
MTALREAGLLPGDFATDRPRGSPSTARPRPCQGCGARPESLFRIGARRLCPWCAVGAIRQAREAPRQ